VNTIEFLEDPSGNKVLTDRSLIIWDFYYMSSNCLYLDINYMTAYLLLDSLKIKMDVQISGYDSKSHEKQVKMAKE